MLFLPPTIWNKNLNGCFGHNPRKNGGILDLHIKIFDDRPKCFTSSIESMLFYNFKNIACFFLISLHSRYSVFQGDCFVASKDKCQQRRLKITQRHRTRIFREPLQDWRRNANASSASDRNTFGGIAGRRPIPPSLPLPELLRHYLWTTTFFTCCPSRFVINSPESRAWSCILLMIPFSKYSRTHLTRRSCGNQKLFELSGTSS